MTIPAVRSPDWSSTEHLPVTVNNAGHAGSGYQLVTGIGLIIAITGYSTTTTTASQYELQDGTDTTGEIKAFIGAPAAGNFALGAGPPGIAFRRGLFLNHVAGTMLITVTYIPVVNPF